MLEQIKKDILEILKEGIKAVKEDNVVKLRNLSNQTLHNSSIFQDENAITIAVVMYALGKIFNRSSYLLYKDWKVFYKITLESLENAEKKLINNDEKGYHENIKQILNVINKLSSNLKRYIQETIEEAQVAKGSRLYEHGISIGKTAELLGISKWELMEYAGKTGIYDMKENISMSIQDRIKFTRGLFK